MMIASAPRLCATLSAITSMFAPMLIKTLLRFSSVSAFLTALGDVTL